MNGYVLVHIIDDSQYSGHYVSRPNSKCSYTPRLEEADVFASRLDAEQHCCVENENIVSLASLFGPSAQTK